MSENKYYDGTKLLSMKDINGLKPELFLCIEAVVKQLILVDY